MVLPNLLITKSKTHIQQTCMWVFIFLLQSNLNATKYFADSTNKIIPHFLLGARIYNPTVGAKTNPFKLVQLQPYIGLDIELNRKNALGYMRLRSLTPTPNDTIYSNSEISFNRNINYFYYQHNFIKKKKPFYIRLGYLYSHQTDPVTKSVSIYSPVRQGVFWEIGTQFKWLHFAFRHQTILGDYFSIINRPNFSLNIEYNISLKK